MPLQVEEERAWKSSSNILLTREKGKATAEVLPQEEEEEEEEEEEDEEERSETSSIGACSSAGDEEDQDQDQEEVQSKPNSTNNTSNDDESKKSSLSSLDSLDDSLPFKRGLSNFYSGKSKSFTSLSTAATATAKDIVKPENPLNKRRRLFIARSRNRRASCSSLVSIAEAESPFLPLLPPVLSECDDEEDDEEAQESLEQAESPEQQQQPRPMMRRSHTEKRRPSLFTVSITPFDARPDRDSFPTPKSVRGGSGSSKLALKSPGRSFSLSDLSRHAHPMPDFDD